MPSLTARRREIAHLKHWIDNSLDLYKPELRRLLYPIFVHSFLELVKNGYVIASQTFYKEHALEHENTHGHDLKGLKALSLPQHIEDDQLARLYRENKYRVNLSKTTFTLLMHFLEETKDAGGNVILRFINQRIDIKTLVGRPTMFSTTGDDEAMMGEDEGIPGHTSGRLDRGGVLPHVRLGHMPMDRELMADVEDELRDEDARMKDVTRSDELGVSTGGTLVDEFQKIKREESEDSPMRDVIPLPPYTGVDVEREVRLVKESRDKVRLHGVPSPSLPSVCMYTFHNTHDGYVFQFPIGVNNCS